MGKTIRPYPYCCRIQVLIACFFFFLFSQAAVLADDIPVPANPLEPIVDISPFKSFNQIQEIKVSAFITLHGMVEKKHVIVFPQINSTFEVFSDDFPGKKDVKLGDFYSLEIARWSGKEDKGGSFIFYPDRYILILKNGEKINVNKNIPLFNSLRVLSDKGEDVFFSYFYDYYKKGIWINRNEKSAKPVSSVPVKGCVTSFKVN